MEIEKLMTVSAPAARVWDMLLDPAVMGGCVPGMKSIEVISPTEYVALMHVKISFVSAKFRLKTRIVEQRAPHYLRSVGTGEDASVASSLKQQSEIFLAELPDGGTELKMVVKVDVVGRLGSFGLSVMKTKADRMWEEFGQNLVQRIEGEDGGDAGPEEPSAAKADRTPEADPEPDPEPDRGEQPAARSIVVPAVRGDMPAPQDEPGWWPRLRDALVRRGRARDDGRSIRIQVQRDGTTITVHWPVAAAGECAALLRDCLRA